MSTWNTASLELATLDGLIKNVQSALKALNAVEAVLEKVLVLVKSLSIDLSNPIRAQIALLLATIRLITNQLKSSGISVLLIHPDFSRQDTGAMIASVSGAYKAFEQKLIYKFNDTSDLFRPTYPGGSSVAMVVFYIGVETIEPLLQQLYSLLNFLKHPSVFTELSAPINVSVKPILASSDAAAQATGAVVTAINKFSDIFSTDFSKSLSVEWRMPSTASFNNSPGFMNHFVSAVNSYRYTKFLIERSESTNGQTITRKITTPTTGKVLEKPLLRFNLQSPVSSFDVREPDGKTLYRHFEKKQTVSGVQLVRGALEGTYRFIDTDSTLEAGKSYSYRVRAYFGDPKDYINASAEDLKAESSPFIKENKSILTMYYGDGVTMGRPSSIARGVIPSNSPDQINLYNDIYNAIMAGLLLNFELPPADPTDSPTLKNQKTGWGTLSSLAGLVTIYKTYLDSTDFKDDLLVQTAVRRATNMAASKLYQNTKMSIYLNKLWESTGDPNQESVKKTVDRILNPPGGMRWAFPDLSVGDLTLGFSASSKQRINTEYLSKEDGYKLYGAKTTITPVLSGPYPTLTFKYGNEQIEVTPAQRDSLAKFIGSVLASLNLNSSYLRWYSVSIGDLIPSFLPFIFDFEQFILSLLKAMDSAMKEIADVIETVIQKIKQLEVLLSQITKIFDILNFSVRVSVLGYSDSNGSVDSMIEAIQSSGGKPEEYPYGLHSGMVLTAGGIDKSAAKSLKALCSLIGVSF